MYVKKLLKFYIFIKSSTIKLYLDHNILISWRLYMHVPGQIFCSITLLEEF